MHVKCSNFGRRIRMRMTTWIVSVIVDPRSLHGIYRTSKSSYCLIMCKRTSTAITTVCISYELLLSHRPIRTNAMIPRMALIWWCMCTAPHERDSKGTDLYVLPAQSSWAPSCFAPVPRIAGADHILFRRMMDAQAD